MCVHQPFITTLKYLHSTSSSEGPLCLVMILVMARTGAKGEMSHLRIGSQRLGDQAQASVVTLLQKFTPGWNSLLRHCPRNLRTFH